MATTTTIACDRCGKTHRRGYGVAFRTWKTHIIVDGPARDEDDLENLNLRFRCVTLCDDCSGAFARGMKK